MYIQFVWPASQQPFRLARDLTIDNAAVFDATGGVFNQHNAHLGQDAVAFYWHMARLVMVNLSAHALCRLDGVEVPYGSVQPLREGNSIQIGHFKLGIIRSSPGEENESSLYVTPPPEVEEILPNKGRAINDLRYFNEVILAQDNGEDILKTLELEYKRFLIWQEQNSNPLNEFTRQQNYILKSDSRFEQDREQIKDKTLTECILDRVYLMEELWPELEREPQWSELFAEDERKDLLRILSSNKHATQNKKILPELIFQDYYKIGLDSHY